MVREIVKDPFFLSLRSEPATPEDLPLGQDLLDTLAFHREGCVGLTANMIGVRKRVIAVDWEGTPLVMYNPEILRAQEPYDTQEGCLSLEGQRPTRRYRSIKVRWQNEAFQFRIRTFTGWTAQIIQHEMDHCQGILI